MMKHGSTSSKILIVNPNSTASMTRKIDQAAQGCRADKTQVVTVRPLNTPACIEDYYDEAMSCGQKTCGVRISIQAATGS